MIGLRSGAAVVDEDRRHANLARIASDLSEGANFSITQLTTLKSLCEDPEIAAHFAVYLARHTSRRANKRSKSRRLSKDDTKYACIITDYAKDNEA
jgi:hypothetical protein